MVARSQWLAALQRIATSPTERAQMKVASQNYLTLNQSHEALVSKWNRVITESLKS